MEVNYQGGENIHESVGKKVFRGEIFRGKLNQSYVAIVDVA